jgi:selT/selW/selH-like putative selenoprotein
VQARFPAVDVRLIESSGGAFEVTVDGTVVFSKLRLGRHAHEGEVVRLIEQLTQQRGGGVA